MLGVTADTNVYVSALNFGGKPLELLAQGRAGRIKLSISEPILAEVLRVLRDRFRWDEPHILAVEEQIRGFTELVTSRQTLNVIKHDPPDNRILECASEAKSDYIVSGDLDLLRLKEYGGAPVVRVAEFLRELEQTGPER